MKLSIIASVSAFTTDNRIARDVEEKGEKRYKQLVDMMFNYNKDFDERKYWTYGCHCLMLGDRSMSDMGKGKPLDALDTACKAYKDCQRCAREEYGKQCIGEFVKYKYGYSNNEVICKDKGNTCKRALCECDAMFARAHVGVKDVWTTDYHGFWANNNEGFDADNTDNCSAGPGSDDMQCCTNGDITSPYLWYNAYKYQCCPNGQTVELGQSC